MLIFLGWSGEESKAVTLALKDFLKKVCQAFEPWMSEMIEKGARWSPAIAEKLRQSKAGVFVVTPDNLASEWLHFEAAAISNVPGAKVCTYLRRVTAAGVREPLRAFQHTKAGDQADTLEMVKTLWRQMPPEESRLTESELVETFNGWWPAFEKRNQEIKPPEGGAAPPKPDPTEIMEQTLTLVRELVERDRARAGEERAVRYIPAGWLGVTGQPHNLAFTSGWGATGGMPAFEGIGGESSNVIRLDPEKMLAVLDDEKLLQAKRRAQAKRAGQRWAVDNLPPEEPKPAGPAGGPPGPPEDKE